jgi:hypothetical protein
MQHHPDKGGDEEKFKELTGAYEMLTDPKKRDMYDQVGDEGMKSGGDGMEHGDIPDFFNHIFGRRGAAESNRSNNSVYPLNVALEDFYNGCVRKIRITRNVVCAECKGKGGKGDDVKKCMECNGNGVIRIRRQVGPGMIQEMQMPCKKCRGVGTLIPDHARCKVCKGNKVVEQSKTLEVVILWMYPRGKSVADKFSVHTIAGAVNIGSALGADFIKINRPLSEDYKGLQEITAAGEGSRLLFAGGDTMSAGQLLRLIHEEVNGASIAGAAVGRNIHQRPLTEAVALANAIAGVVYDGQTPEITNPVL